MIRDCVVIAVEGTHASGKTTLVHALTSHLRERGLHAACTGEPARHSPFLEEIVLHNKGEFDRAAELDLFGAQITTQLRAARNQQALVTDKTLLNVIAYSSLLLPEEDTPLLNAMTYLCGAATYLYDAVFYTSDAFDPRQAGDDFRAKVADRQHDVDKALRTTAAEVGLPLINVPQGLSTAKRVEWISTHLAETNLLSALG
ncbi:AAA family ATPase [Streptosporangium saharense]|uniref:AAA family ATPase n=1 Tax=Streptosporangium saharense TaxID=1706840 RepID=UPI003681E879